MTPAGPSESSGSQAVKLGSSQTSPAISSPLQPSGT